MSGYGFQKVSLILSVVFRNRVFNASKQLVPSLNPTFSHKIADANKKESNCRLRFFIPANCRRPKCFSNIQKIEKNWTSAILVYLIGSTQKSVDCIWLFQMICPKTCWRPNIWGHPKIVRDVQTQKLKINIHFELRISSWKLHILK